MAVNLEQELKDTQKKLRKSEELNVELSQKVLESANVGMHLAQQVEELKKENAMLAAREEDSND